MILNPIIPEQGLTMIYASRGIGKTHVSMAIAFIVANGGTMLNGKWQSDQPRKVLFVDGEMPASALQERLAYMVAGSDPDFQYPENLEIITPDLQESSIPDLSTRKGQIAIEEHLEGISLLILDNLSSLCRLGRENESESWLPVQEWLLGLRRRGISVLLIHHANKNGGQRGTSRKEDLLDTVISLRRPQDYDPTQGARFEVHYEKARGFNGEEAKPFEVSLKISGNQMEWGVKELEDLLFDQVLDLSKNGLTQREIASEMKISLSKVNRILKKAKKEGKLK